MIDILLALAPIFLLIVFGYVLRQRRIAPDGFWAPAEGMTFNIFFPALLFRNIATADIAGGGGWAAIWSMSAACVTGILIMGVLVVSLRRFLNVDGPAYTSVFQGSMRPNVYLGIAAGFTLFGDEGLTLVSICIAIGASLVNVLGVTVLVRHAGRHGQAPTLNQTIGPILRNPVILACGTGALWNATGFAIPPVIDPVLEILGRASLPLALLAVGAGMDLHAVKRDAPIVALTSVLKVIVLPLITWGVCIAYGVGPLQTTIVVMYASLPGSGTAYVLARQMGGDAVLLAGSITATTLLAAIAMPVILLSLN